MLHLYGIRGTDAYTLALWVSTRSSKTMTALQLAGTVRKYKLDVCPELPVPTDHQRLKIKSNLGKQKGKVDATNPYWHAMSVTVER